MAGRVGLLVLLLLLCTATTPAAAKGKKGRKRPASDTPRGPGRMEDTNTLPREGGAVSAKPIGAPIGGAPPMYIALIEQRDLDRAAELLSSNPSSIATVDQQGNGLLHVAVRRSALPVAVYMVWVCYSRWGCRAGTGAAGPRKTSALADPSAHRPNVVWAVRMAFGSHGVAS
jgi:hypothetical protein